MRKGYSKIAIDCAGHCAAILIVVEKNRCAVSIIILAVSAMKETTLLHLDNRAVARFQM